MRGLFKLSKPDQPLGGRYKIISELGAGGFGQTFLAEDLHLPDHPRCVVKQLKPQATDAATLQTARRLFDIEARVLYKLGNHDQIPHLLAHFEDNQEFYLAQELIDGEPLTQELKGGQHWSESQVIGLLQDLLNVLAFVHQQSVIHRDLKPSNLIRRRQDDRIVLIDFGAVKQVSTQITSPLGEHTKTISIGTQGYTPKEQLGGNPRFSSDVYAAGIIAIQALTGIHPRHLTDDPVTGEISWHHHAPHVSPEFAAFLDQMVRYDYRARYPTAVEALDALHNLFTSHTQSVASSPSWTEEDGELPTQARQSPSTTEATESELGQAPTHIRTPTNSPAQPQGTEATGSELGQAATQQWTPPDRSVQPPVTGTGATYPWGQSPQPPSSSIPPTVTPGSSQRRLVPLWSTLAVLAAVGATFWGTKTFLSPQFSERMAGRSGIPAASPSINPSEPVASPSSASSPTVSPSANPDQPAASPSSASSPTPSPSTNSSQAPAPPAAASSPTTPPASSAPVKAASPAKSTPAAVPPPTKPSAPSAAAPQAIALLQQAERSREAGQYQKALELYDQVIALNPNRAEAHWGRCYSLNSLQQPNDAIAACNQALALKPNDPKALWSKGNALDQQKRPEESLKLYQKATALDPNFAEAWNNQGVALLSLGRTREAVMALNRATKLKPDFANAWANRGAALWKLGRPKEAILSINTAARLQPNNPDIINLQQQIKEQLRF